GGAHQSPPGRRSGMFDLGKAWNDRATTAQQLGHAPNPIEVRVADEKPLRVGGAWRNSPEANANILPQFFANVEPGTDRIRHILRHTCPSYTSFRVRWSMSGDLTGAAIWMPFSLEFIRYCQIYRVVEGAIGSIGQRVNVAFYI